VPDAEVIAAIQGFASTARSTLFLVQAVDLALETTATNLPGTDRERANWRRRLAIGTADLWTSPTGVLTLAACANRRRPAGTSG
jgi:glycogen operon protein